MVHFLRHPEPGPRQAMLGPLALGLDRPHLLVHSLQIPVYLAARRVLVANQRIVHIIATKLIH